MSDRMGEGIDPAPATAPSTSSNEKVDDTFDKTANLETNERSITDEESGNVGQIQEGEEPSQWERRARYAWKTYHLKHVCWFLCWALWTIWWARGLALYRQQLGWLLQFLLWLAITLRIITFYIPARYVLVPLQFTWDRTCVPVYNAIPKALHQPLAALGTLGIFLIGSMIPAESGDNTRKARAQSLFGLAVMIGVMTLTSKKWRKIPWHTVIGGMLTQFVIAVFVLKTQVGYDIFNFISFLARTLLGFAEQGVAFLTDDTVPNLPWFFISVIPAIIFFVALVSLCFYIGLIQWFIGKFAVFFFWTLRVSGAEAVVAAATPFIGQGESAMLIKPFVPHLTNAEIHQIMTCGFATIAGSVLVAYISMGLNPQALVSSCIMSIPASLAISKMRYPELEQTLTSGECVVPPDDETDRASNALHAFANGAWLGLKIAGMIVATLLCIIAFVGLINGFLYWWGSYWGYFENGHLSLEFILGYIFYPVAWLLGVPNQDLLLVGQLIGTKIIINEFAAFSNLVDPTLPYSSMLPRSQLIATYACCGFGNIGSLGTQIGVLAQISPNRSGDVSKLALSSLAAGIISTLSSASIAGMLATDGLIAEIINANGS